MSDPVVHVTVRFLDPATDTPVAVTDPIAATYRHSADSVASPLTLTALDVGVYEGSFVAVSRGIYAIEALSSDPIPATVFGQAEVKERALDTSLTVSGSSSGAAGGVLSGTYPNPGFAVDMATQAELDAAIAGVGGSSHYRHVQGSPSATWAVNHALGYKPGGVTAVDSSLSDQEGAIEHVDDDNLIIHFGAAFSGEAYIS